MSPVAAVRRFVDAWRDVRARFFGDLAPIDGLDDLLTAVRSRRELPRRGVTASGIEYSVHGAGCWMRTPGGAVVDIDLVHDSLTGQRVEAFDSWRIRAFLADGAEVVWSEAEIEAACRRLVETGVLRVVNGFWFSVPDPPPSRACSSTPAAATVARPLSAAPAAC
ncbi:hypothetical protein AB0J83_36430 [Actinoplanes sp. NPDC049596]|uniref:DUF6896 domain-containing protein n=1 Tax=unclassified Actinoplanes TaxID=2626549 RepID=UPI0034483949